LGILITEMATPALDQVLASSVDAIWRAAMKPEDANGGESTPPDVAADTAGAAQGEATRSEAQHSEAVVRLYSQHQRWLFGYLVTLLSNPQDAEDVMQEVSVVMWREHRNFELGTNFTGWLSVIAYHQVQKFWRNRKRNATYLDISVIDQLASVITKDREVVDIRRQFLGECLEDLPSKDRELVETVYSSEVSGKIRRFAQKSGVDEAGFYRSLARIRKALFNCVQRKLAAEGISG
jgi:RNA polymerase sigma-70 factor (ECF subfamily)